jgi:hypothetical protein
MKRDDIIATIVLGLISVIGYAVVNHLNNPNTNARKEEQT